MKNIQESVYSRLQNGLKLTKKQIIYAKELNPKFEVDCRTCMLNFLFSIDIDCDDAFKLIEDL